MNRDALERELAAARTERDEAQARAAALAEVLQAINASPQQPGPVFDMIIGKAMALCDAAFGALLTYEGDHLTMAAQRNGPLALVAHWETPQYVDPSTATSQVLHEGRTVQIIDLAQSENYRNRVPMTVASVELGGIRTLVMVPLRSERGPIGLFILYRREVRPFTNRQVTTVEAFAAQAALAMENARLLTQQREALEQQTAMAEILRAINVSRGDVKPVFDLITERAMTMCGGDGADLIQFKDGFAISLSIRNPTPGQLEYWKSPVDVRDVVPVVNDPQTRHFLDLADTIFYKKRVPIVVASVEGAGIRTFLQVPLLGESGVIGEFALYRRTVRPFSNQQVALVEAFASQAALAMENARLLTEQREALEQQTATAGILHVISQSPTDIAPVMVAVAKAAVRFCGAEDAHVFLRDDGEMVSSAHEGPLSSHPLGYRDALDASNTARADTILEARVTHLPDTLAPEAEAAYRSIRENSIQHGFRAQLNAPMLKDGQAIGCICLRRRDPGAFTPRQIALLETFAAQAVIAIENVRLFTELRDSLDQQTATAEILRAISRSPTDVRPVLDVVVKAAQRFCGAEDVVISLREGEELAIAAHDGPIGAPPPRRVLDRSSTQGRAVIDATPVHLPDVSQLDPAEWSTVIAITRQVDAQAAVAVPMLREGAAVGAIMLRRRESGPFSPRQIELLEIFAAQAVIAIENVRLFTELRDSLEQQTASADVLRVISQSPTSVQPVFDVIAESALRLLGGWSVVVWRYDGSHLHIGAAKGGHPGSAEVLPAMLEGLAPEDIFVGDAVRNGAVQRIIDIETEEVAPQLRELARARGWRSNLAVPMMRDGQPVGVFTLARAEPGAFSDRDVQLLQSFAAQAVIAIENVRLFTELKESLEYQTATSDVLSVISRSTSELEPVLKSMLAAATRLCGVHMGGVAVRRGDVLRYVTSTGVSAEFDKWLRETPHPMNRSSIAGRAAIDKRVTYIPNVAADPDYAMPITTTVGNMQSLLAVPLLREDEVVGVMTLGRSNTEPFTERQIALVRTFADQAVIAMENTRLLADLRESLDYQTATSEVLEVISRSTSDLAPVLNKMLAAAAHLCGVEKGDVSIRRDGQMRYAASIGTSPAEDTWLRTRVIAADRSTCAGRAMVTRQIVHVLDQSADAELAVPRQISAHQTVLSVPLLREDEAIGVITVLRDHVEAFTERQIALIKTFADQAVIAIENARLLGELRERQNELRVTFDNMGDAVVMFDAQQRLAAWNRNFQEMLDVSDSFLSERPTLDDYVRLLVGRGELGEVSDIEAEMARFHVRFEQQWSAERTRPDGRILEVRNNPVPGGGAVLIYSDITERKKAEANIRTARDAAEAALLQLKAAQANLVQSEKMASLGQLTAGIAHEIKNPLNFVNNFASLSVELLDELKEIAGPALETLAEDKRADLDETMGLLTGNLGKIAEHGKRADGIVKSMLSHSRGGSGDWQASDINALVEEALNLAYHGARAQDKEFNVTLERDFEKDSRPIELVPQDVMRVFLNLVGNGFYAANKRRLAKEAGFRPTLKVSTRDLGEQVEIRVRDNGIGIPAEVRDKLFQPFFTTKPTGEGTGLGLSISYDIVTQQHGGEIEVKSEVGTFTEFTVRLPRIPRVASAKRA